MLTDTNVIKHLEAERAADKRFMNRDDSEYEAYQKGQATGVRRAMAFLRATGVLKPVIKKGTKYFVFS